MITNPNVKINLGLNILRKREDGFHDLETLFVPYFGIHDTLEIVVGDDYSRTSAAIFGKYAPEMIAQGISEDGSLMITIAREEGVDWDPLKDLMAKAYYLLAEDFNRCQAVEDCVLLSGCHGLGFLHSVADGGGLLRESFFNFQCVHGVKGLFVCLCLFCDLVSFTLGVVHEGGVNGRYGYAVHFACASKYGVADSSPNFLPG